MISTIHAIYRTIIYFIISHLAFIMLSMSSFNMLLISPLYHKNVRPATVVSLDFFPLRRETVNTGKGLLVPLDKLKLPASNFGSLLMDSLI